MLIIDNRVKVHADGVDAGTSFFLKEAVFQFSVFPPGLTRYTALASTGEWEVGYGNVTGVNLLRTTVEQNHLGTTDHIDFTGKTLQIAKTNTAEYYDEITNKLDGIEDEATQDQSATEIKSAYESNDDTNAFTNAYEINTI